MILSRLCVKCEPIRGQTNKLAILTESCEVIYIEAVCFPICLSVEHDYTVGVGVEVSVGFMKQLLSVLE